MQEQFIAHLRQGKFKIPICMSCDMKVWPPSPICPRCLSSTALKNAKKIGKLVEFSHSRVKDKEAIFALVNLDDVFVLGSLKGKNLRKGMTVRIAKCGLLQDGTPFYRFVPFRSRR